MTKTQAVLLLISVLIGFFLGFTSPEPAARSITTHMVGVNGQNGGILVRVRVSMIPGNGKILVNIDNPLFITDTQESLRTAVKAAAEYTGINSNDYDFIFSVEEDNVQIEGPSAGASMAAALVALIENKQIKAHHYATGSITENGSITAVGSILEKAETLSPGEVLIVPAGQKVGTEQIEDCSEKQSNNYYYKECKIKYEPVDVSEKTGVKVIEVNNLDELVQIMLE